MATMRARRLILIVGATLYFVVVVGLAFVPGSAANRTLWVWPLAAFVPVGIFLVMLLGPRRWWAAIGFAVLGAAWLEAAQSIWMPVGYAEAMDVLWSGLGAILGVALAVVVSKRAPHKAHRIVAHPGR